MKSTRAKWWLWSLLLILALCVEIFYLVNDIPIFKVNFDSYRGFHQRAEPIAQLMSKVNSVRLQPAGDLVWEDTQANQQIFRLDSILTMERSKAEVAFLDGTGLVIDENSLVQIEKNENQADSRIVLKLLRGSIRKSLSKGPPQQLPSGGLPVSEIQIQVGEVFASVTPQSEFTIRSNPESPQQAQIIVRDGAVPLRTSEGSTVVKSGEEAAISKTDSSSGSVSTRQMIFLLLQPAMGEVLELQNTESQKVSFRWKTHGAGTGGSALELETSPDPEFRSNLHHLRIGSTEPPLEYIEASLSLPVSSEPTLWFWRVRTADRSRLFSETSRFWLQTKKIRPAQSLPVMKEGFQSILNPTQAPPPPAKIYTPEIIPEKKTKKNTHR